MRVLSAGFDATSARPTRVTGQPGEKSWIPAAPAPDREGGEILGAFQSFPNSLGTSLWKSGLM